MKEYHLFFAPGLPSDLLLPTEEAGHALRVLRLREGDELQATDGRGTLYSCRIAEASRHGCRLRIESAHEGEALTRGRIHLAVAPTKNADRIEWLAEKATEMGMTRLTLLLTRNTERRNVNMERISRILVAATKQSHRLFLPRLDPAPVEVLTFFREAASRSVQRFVAHCYNDLEPRSFLPELLSPGSDMLTCIGPEGDFTPEEVYAACEAGFVPVSLGSLRLRTETAALMATAMMYVSNRAD